MLCELSTDGHRHTGSFTLWSLHPAAPTAPAEGRCGLVSAAVSKLVTALMTRQQIFLYCAQSMVYKRWTTWELPALKPGHLNRSRASRCCKSETSSSMLEDRTCATLKPQWRMKYRDKPVQNEWMDGFFMLLYVLAINFPDHLIFLTCLQPFLMLTFKQ